MEDIPKYSVKKTSRIECRTLNCTLVSAIRETLFSTFPLCPFLNPEGEKLDIFGDFRKFRFRTS